MIGNLAHKFVLISNIFMQRLNFLVESLGTQKITKSLKYAENAYSDLLKNYNK